MAIQKKHPFLSLFREGLAAATPIFIGYFSASIAFGLLARNAGMLFIDTLGFSVICFTGSAQFLAVNLIAAGASAGELIISFAMLNLRYFLMSASLTQKWDFPNKGHRFLLAFGITDENFAVSSARKGKIKPAFQLGVEFLPWSGWIAGTITGYIAGSLLPPSLQAAMEGALYALFAALLVPEIKKGFRYLLVAGIAGVINSILIMVLGMSAGWSFVIAMLCAAVCGMFILPDHFWDRKEHNPKEDIT